MAKETLFERFRKVFVENKIRIQRSLSYMSIANSGMILFLVLSNLQKEYKFDIYITKWFFPIYVLTLGLFLLVGWIDDKVGFHREEARASAKKSPLMIELIDTVKRLEEKVDLLQEENRKIKK